MNETVRPTKKQRDLLTFIEQFIGEHGYSPSYREIMNGLNYNSVATVSLHVNSLIQRGHLRKRDRSARSLEVVETTGKQSGAVSSQDKNIIEPAQEKWLIDIIEGMFRRIESTEEIMENAYNEMSVLINALRVLGLHAAASSFMPRLAQLRVKVNLDDNFDTQDEV